MYRGGIYAMFSDMNSDFCILAGDIGTTSIKTALFNSHLHIIAGTSCSLNTHFHRDIPGSAEQDPKEWVLGFLTCIDDLYKAAPQSFSDIALLSLTGQMEDLIAIDGEGKPLCNAFLYSDSRAKEEAEIINEHFGMEDLLEITGNEFNVLSSCAKILWLKRNLPDIFSRAHSFIFGSKDFINFQLTGNNFTDYTTASTTGLLNMQQRRWDSTLMKYMHIQNTSLPVIERAGMSIGEIKEGWLPRLHLKKRVPVLNGMGDAASATLGAGICKENEAYLYGGTTGWVARLSKKRKTLPVYNLLNHEGIHYINVSPILNAGNALDWGIKTFYLKGRSETIDYKKIDALITRTGTSTNLIFLPYLNGERSPFHDEAARGMIFGLTLNIKSEDILRSIFEGVAFSFLHNIQALGVKNTGPIPVTGGITQFHSFCQILAHVTGRTVEKLKKEYSSPLFGAAVLAYRSLQPSSQIAPSPWVKIEKNFYPEESKTKCYSRIFAIYRDLYPHLKDEYKRLSTVQNSFH